MINLIKKIYKIVNQYRPTVALNIYFAMVIRLLTVMVLMQQSRLVFYIYNQDLFNSTEVLTLPQLMIGGLPFDLAGMLYINSLFIIMQILPFRFTTRKGYQLASKIIFVVTNGLGVIANNLDIAYYPYTLRRSTALIFKEFSNEDNLLSIAGEFVVDYWLLVIMTICMIVTLTLTYSSVKVWPLFNGRARLYYPTAVVAMFITLLLFVGGVRGGFTRTTRPITISNASEYVINPGEEPLVLNTPFSLIRTTGEEPLPHIDYISEDKVESIYNPNHHYANDTFNKKNVVVIIWESLGSEYVNSYNRDKNIEGYKSYTPFLDSLLQHSTYFTRSISSGKKSIDAMASIFAAIPSLTQPFVLSTYSNNYIPSLPRILGEEGYHTSFFHGAPNGSMGLLAFSNKLGISEYYGKEEYDNWRKGNNHFDGVWGISDDKFLEFYSEKLNSLPTPFFSSVFTLSSHHPFKVPDGLEGKFPKGDVEIHGVIGYTDYALKNFFERAKKEAWYNNTIFVITGDHPNQSRYSHYTKFENNYRVPIVIFDPQAESGSQQEQVAGHIDIFPTVLKYLGYNKPFFSLGQNLLSGNDDNFTVGYLNGYILYYKDDYLLFNNNSVIQSSTDNIERRDSMELMVKAFIQEHNNRMINNNLVTDKKE